MASPEPTFTERLVALQHRDFRLLWIGQIISLIGTRMQLFAVDWQVYQLLTDVSYDIEIFGFPITVQGDALGLGTLGLVRILPIIIFALFGGMVADTRDRRTIMIWGNSFAALTAVLLTVFTLTDQITLIAIYILTSVTGAASAFEFPARQAILPNLVPNKHLTNAISLNTLTYHIAWIIGPSIAGLMIAKVNLGVIYAVNAVSFAAVLIALFLMHHRRDDTIPVSGVSLSSMIEGLRFVMNTPLIWSTMLLDFFATLFASARTMLPIIAEEVLNIGPTGYGILGAAQPIGSVLAGTATALSKDIKQQGLVLLISVAIYGVATALFGVSTIFALSFILFAMTGAADTVSTVIRNTIRQLATPDRLRGRMTSVNMIFFMGGPQLGELEAGIVASVLGVPLAVFSGGILTVLLTGWVGWRYPRLRRFTSDEYEEMQKALA